MLGDIWSKVKSCSRPGQRGPYTLCPHLPWNAHGVNSYCTLTMDNEIHHHTVPHQRQMWILQGSSMMIAKAHMRGLWEAGGRCCFHLLTLYVSLSFHWRFTLIFSHAWHIDTVDVHWCSSCLHGLALRSPGSWLGGSRVSASRLFCLAPRGSSRDVDGLSLCFTMDDLLRTRHTSCLVITFQVVFDASFHGLVVVWFCLLCFCWGLFLVCLRVAFVVFCVGSVSFLFPVEWHHTAWHHESMKPATVSASLAVISTASKYLHNDLARAIEALEQKKLWASKILPETPWECRAYSTPALLEEDSIVSSFRFKLSVRVISRRAHLVQTRVL